MDRDEFISRLKSIYKPLKGQEFEAECEESGNTSAMITGGPRDILVVQDQDTIAILGNIIDEVEKLQRKYNQLRGSPKDTERVWKGITDYGDFKLWVPPFKGSEDGLFRVVGIRVLTDSDVNMQKEYIAIVNIMVEEAWLGEYTLLNITSAVVFLYLVG